MKKLLVVCVVVLAACSSNSEGDTSELAPVSTSSVESPTTTSVATPITVAESAATAPTKVEVSVAQIAVIQAVAEWNSGDSERWRATFAPDAAQLVAGYDIEANRFVDQYEFFARLNSQLVLLGCETVEGDRGEAVDCSLESTNVFSERLGFEPTSVSMHVEFFEEKIVYWSEHFDGANLVRSEWWEFAAWVSEINSEHGETIKPFPGNADSADLALTYFQDYLDR